MLTADIKNQPTFNISPVTFSGTPIDGEVPGNRGWWRGVDTDSEGSYGLGQIHPDDSEITNVRLISDQRVWVNRNTLTNLAKIIVDGTEYALTRVPQASGYKVAPIDGLPDVDYYTITGGLPQGDWDKVRFETSTAGTFIPASVDIPKGHYQRRNSCLLYTSPSPRD